MFSFFKKKEYKLTPIQELLLALLRAQLWLKPVDDIVLPSSLDEWDELINLGYKQTVICFIAKACLRHPESCNIPSDIKEEFEAVLEENKRIHEYHNSVLIELITKFEEQGLHPILLKGQGIAQMYPEPELRQCGDIDLYFRPDEFDVALSYMKTIEDDGSNGRLDYKHYDTKYNGVEVELHRRTVKMPNPWHNKAFQKLTVDDMRSDVYIYISSHSISVPNAEYNFVYSLIHSLHHYEKQSISLRQICDFMMLLNHNMKSIVFKHLCSELSRFDLLRFWNVMLTLISEYMGMSIEETLFVRKPQACILIYTSMDTGACCFGKLNYNSHSNYVIRKTKSFFRITHKMIECYPVVGTQIVWQYLLMLRLPFFNLLWKRVCKYAYFYICVIFM